MATSQENPWEIGKFIFQTINSGLRCHTWTVLSPVATPDRN